MRYDRHGHRNSRWKGGRRRRKDGYIIVYSPGHPFACKNFVLEHRLVVEASIGRYLLPHEVVHHKNKNRSDNRQENLLLTSHREHMHHHAGDERKHAHWRPRVSKDELYKLYWMVGLTKLQCSQRLGISYGGLHRHFIEFNIPRRRFDPWWVRKNKAVGLSGQQ